jgi:hypothetical protein
MKFDINDLVNEILDQFPSNIWTSSSTTFIDPAMGGGQFVKEIEKRLKKYGHSNNNIKKRVHGISPSSLRTNFAVNKHKLVGNYKTNEKFLESEINMKFDVVVGNPPYTQGKKFLYRYFFEKSLELGDKVAMVMPLNLHSKYDSLKEFNKLVKTHNEFISHNVSHHFGVGLDNIHYVVASKNTYNEVDDYKDLLDEYKEIYTKRKRLTPTLGNTPVGFTKNYDNNGKEAVVKVLQGGPDIRKIKTDVVNRAKQKTTKPYVVFHNNAPSIGKFNVYVHETKDEITWSQHVFAYQFENKEDANKLATWLKSDIITKETKKMLDIKKKHTISLEMLRKLPWYE